MSKLEFCLTDQPTEEQTPWDKQIVWLPVSQLLHYQRSVIERDQWAARNYELQKELDELRTENARLNGGE